MSDYKNQNPANEACWLPDNISKMLTSQAHIMGQVYKKMRIRITEKMLDFIKHVVYANHVL